MSCLVVMGHLQIGKTNELGQRLSVIQDNNKNQAFPFTHLGYLKRHQIMKGSPPVDKKIPNNIMFHFENVCRPGGGPSGLGFSSYFCTFQSSHLVAHFYP